MIVQQERLISLLKVSLGFKSDNFSCFGSMNHEDWALLLRYAKQEGVGAFVFDGLEKLLPKYRPDRDSLMQWIGYTSHQEMTYKKHKDTIAKLASFYNSHGIKMLLLKGITLSFNYPKPNHRQCGDIDIYLYGDGGKADALMLSELGIASKQNEEKHSIFQFHDITVENHACIINYIRHPSHKKLELFFEKEAENAIPIKNLVDDLDGFFIPSATTNALFLPIHLAEHFVHGEASMRQLVDWACFVQKYHNHINWITTANWAKASGFFKFYCCLNGIVQDYLGVDASLFPNWPRDKELENRVLNEILNKHKQNNLSLYRKVLNYFKSRWRFRLVYNENLLLAAFRQARAYALVQWDKGRNIVWDNSYGSR